jgi:colanic acid/amylovoran biosynthesis glycosyltransferase
VTKLAIFALTGGRVSETFIRDHINHLHPSTVSFFGTDWDVKSSNGNHVLSRFKRSIGSAIRVYSAKTSYRFWAYEMSKVLRKSGVTHILAEFGVTGAYLYRVASRVNAKLVVHFHGYDAFETELLNYYSRFYKEMFANAEALVVVSSSMREQLIENLGAPSHKVHHITCGVSYEKLDKVHRDSTRSQSFVFLGRFVDKKAPDQAIQAFARVIRTFPSATLTLIGDGLLLPSCRRLVKSLGLHESVEFLGALPQQKALEVIASRQIYLQPSIVAESGDREGTPVALIEAQMLGLPCVATRHEGIAEVVEHEVTGFLVEENDIDDMVSYMIMLLSEPELIQRMSVAAKKVVRSKYKQDAQLEKLRRVIFGELVQ